MAGPWEDYQQPASGPWSDYAPKKKSGGEDAARSFGSGVVRGVSGAIDVASKAVLPWLDPLQKMTGAPSAAQTGERLGGSYEPKTSPGGYAKALGEFLPGAAMPGGLLSRSANVIVPALASEAAGQGVESLGAGPGVAAGARLGGALIGGGMAGVRFGPKGISDPAVKTVTQRGNVDPNAARAEAQRYRAAGVEPTLTDVVGEAGRRVIRATGAKDPQAGEVLQNRSRAVTATTKPAVIDRTRQLSDDVRTADEAAADMREARRVEADTTYKPLYQTPVTLDENIMAALSDEPGQAALRRSRQAGVARMDGDFVGEIDSILSPPEAPQPGARQVSAGALDRVRIAMRERGKTAASRNANDLASGYNKRVGMIDETLDSVPELRPARAAYRSKSQAIDILTNKKGAKPDPFSTAPADYSRWVQSLTPEAYAANRLALRQEIMDTLGGQRRNTFGSVDELATSEYARDNLRSALGAEEADKYLANLTARLDQVRNASFVAPNSPSQTALLQNDTGALEKGVSLFGQALRGDPGGAAWGAAREWLLRRGVNEQTAQAIARLSSDPARLDDALQMIDQIAGKQAGMEYRRLIGVAVPGLLTTGAARREDQEPR